MKKLIQNNLIVTFSLLFGATIQCDHPSWAAGEIVSPSSQVTDATLKRFYIVNRIDSHLDLLQKLYTAHPAQLHQLYHHITTVPLDNNFLFSIAQEIAHKKTLTALFEMYSKYRNYQFIENESLDTGFVILIDHITNFFLALPNLGKDIKQTLLLNSTLGKEIETAGNPAIIFRFYFLKRTDHIVNYLVKKIKSPLKVTIPRLGHEVINNCSQDIEILQSIKPYLQLYESLAQYYYLNDIELQHQFLLLTFLLVQHINTHDYSLNEIEINAVKKLSIKELLDALNDLDDNNPPNTQLPADDILNLEKQQSIETLINDEFNISTDEFCSLVLRRYYFINRLSFIDSFPSRHNTVEVSRLKLRLLISEWKNFKRYMFLSDQLVIDDFSEEIFLIAPDASHKKVFLKDSFAILDKDDSTEQTSGIFSDLDPFIDMNNVTLRLYHIKRLENVMIQISFFNDATLSFKNDTISNFSHPATQKCLSKIKESNSITPFLLLSKEFESYFYIRDDIFLREYLTLLHQCHLYLLQHLNPKNNHLTMINGGIIKKKIIEQLSIGELFDKIDSVSMQLAHYNKLNHQRPWLNFFKKILFIHRLSKLWYYFLG